MKAPDRNSRGSAHAFVVPMAAEPARSLPEGEEWLYEVKFDGYRALIIKHGPRVEIRSRNDRDLTVNFPEVAEAAERLNARRAVVDGELVALDPRGVPSFQALQHRGTHPGYWITFYAFDLLQVDGRDLKDTSLATRRERLRRLLAGSGLLLSQELPGTAAQVVRAVRRLGLEGVIAKRKDSRYVPGARSSDWLKLKLERQQEFVIGGYEPGANGVDLLLVGYYSGPALRFAGRVRAGFVPLLRRELAGLLEPLQSRRCPFADLPNARASRWGGGVTAEDMQRMCWVQPKLVAQIGFVEWTAESRLRHPRFIGLRADKQAREVRREDLAAAAHRRDEQPA